MGNITKDLEAILYREIKPAQNKKHIIIIQAVLDAIYNKRIPLGASFPTQAELMLIYNVARKVIEMVWKELKEVHRIIITNKSGGTNVVLVIPTKKTSRFSNVVISHSVQHKLLLNQDIIPERNGLSGSFESDLSKILTKYKALSVEERTVKILPGLTTQFSKRLNVYLGSSFTDKEIYYFHDYHFVIYSICRALLTEKDIFLAVTTVGREVIKAVGAAKKNIMVIKSDRSEISIEKIKLVCMEGKVGIVYVSLASPGSGTESIGKTEMDQLLATQKLYGFTIIFDDRYPGLPGTGNFITGYDIAKHECVIYLKALSRIEQRVYDITMIATDRREMIKIKHQFVGCGYLIEPQMAYALLHLIHNDLLHKHEVRAIKAMKIAFAIVVKELQASHLWKEEGLLPNRNCFIYLEPIDGSFRPDVYIELTKQNIYVFDPDYLDTSSSTRRISISVPPKQNEMQLIHLIQKLNNVLKTMIS